MYCTDEKTLKTKMGSGAIEKSICASGKWCEGGQCVKNENVPQADCLIDDDCEFGERVTKRSSKKSVC